MHEAFENIRIRCFGTQGSGSTFPAKQERALRRELHECDLLQAVFAEMQQRLDAGEPCDPESMLGGPVSADTLKSFRAKFELPEQRMYGGWTTCLLVETSDDYDIVLDCGSGFRQCAQYLQTKWGNRDDRHLYILGSHSHLDHTEGFGQASVCFDTRNTIHVLGNRLFLRVLDTNLGVFTRHVSEALKGVQTPLTFDKMPAKFASCEIGDADAALGTDTRLAHAFHDLSDPLTLGNTKIIAFNVEHPTPCLAYRIEHNQRVFVFCTDHEFRSGSRASENSSSQAAEARLIAEAQNADVLYRDGQFLRDEYDGQKGIGDSTAATRVGWGHSCIEDVVEMAEQAHIDCVYIGHHDPDRPWAELHAIDQWLASWSETHKTTAELARPDTVVDL